MERYPSLLRRLLENRGITTYEAAEHFLHPSYETDLADPFAIRGMARAVDRIMRAIEGGEKIVVWGDYDCDGIPGSVVLHDLFAKIGYDRVTIYIPHRYREGYGLNVMGIEQLAREETRLIITVDSGITDVIPVARANELGIDVIVTDHHLPGAELPPAHTILNSKQEGDTYPFRFLSGAGVAFKLAQAILARLKECPPTTRGTALRVPPDGWEKWLLDVTGISTIADMVPLIGENRALAYFGLIVLRRTPRPGLRALFRRARLSSAHMTEDDVGFTIGPRINAASRMDEPMRAFELLATRDDLRAGVLADHLERKNTERKREVGGMLEKMDERIASKQHLHLPLVVVGDVSWKPGLVGLAASRIVERHGRTAFVWGGEGSTDLKGSCRSDGTVNIVSLMASVKPGVFLDFGGHEVAGGFSLPRSGEVGFEEHLLDAHERTEKREQVAQELLVDGELSSDEATGETYALVSQLAPFGMGNPKPLFRFTGSVVSSARSFGKGKEHLELQLERSDGTTISAIRFFSYPTSLPEPGDRVSLLAHLERSTFPHLHSPTLRLRIVDMV